MKLELSDHDTLRIVTVPEARIDAAVALRFKEAMRMATEGGPDHVVLDLGQVRFVDSSGLGAIVAAPLNLVAAPLNFIINNAVKGFKAGYARVRNIKPKA